MTISRRHLLLGGGALAASAGLAATSQLSGAGASPSPGRSRARPIETDRRPPERADVVIVGGGNLGAATAYYLSALGMSVVLCEKGAIGGEASGRSVGWVHTLGVPQPRIQMAATSLQLWNGLNEELQIDTGFRRNGLMFEIPDEQGMAYWKDWLQTNRAIAPAARILSSKEVRARVNTSRPWFGAVLNPEDGCAEPTLVSPAYAEAARRKGAKIVAPCAVRGFETSGGRVSLVVTELGEIRTSNLVLAGGAWSSALLANSGINLPTAYVFSWCASFDCASGPDGAAGFANTTWRKQIDGGYTTSLRVATAPLIPRLIPSLLEFKDTAKATGFEVRPRLGRFFFEELFAGGSWKLDEVSPFERRRILEPDDYPALIEEMLQAMRDTVIPFRELKAREAWGGAITGAPDSLGVIGPVDRVPGLIVSTAVIDGLSCAPACGKVVSEIMSGQTPSFPLSGFRFERFAS